MVWECFAVYEGDDTLIISCWLMTTSVNLIRRRPCPNSGAASFEGPGLLSLRGLGPLSTTMTSILLQLLNVLNHSWNKCSTLIGMSLKLHEGGTGSTNASEKLTEHKII